MTRMNQVSKMKARADSAILILSLGVVENDSQV